MAVPKTTVDNVIVAFWDGVINECRKGRHAPEFPNSVPAKNFTDFSNKILCNNIMDINRQRWGIILEIGRLMSSA